MDSEAMLEKSLWLFLNDMNFTISEKSEVMRSLGAYFNHVHNVLDGKEIMTPNEFLLSIESLAD